MGLLSCSREYKECILAANVTNGHQRIAAWEGWNVIFRHKSFLPGYYVVRYWTVSLLLLQVLEHRLKEADEMHTLLQLECDKYKAVLAETVGNDLNYILIICLSHWCISPGLCDFILTLEYEFFRLILPLSTGRHLTETATKCGTRRK